MSWTPKNFPVTPKFTKPNLSGIGKVNSKNSKNEKIYNQSVVLSEDNTSLTLPVLPAKFTDRKVKNTKREQLSIQKDFIEESPLILYWSTKVINHEKVDSVAENVKKCTQEVDLVYKSCLKFSGEVSEEIWNEIVDIYENNQNFFYNKFINEEIEEEKYIKYINDLERWFCAVIEPNIIENNTLEDVYVEKDRNYRENYKIINSRSFFCKKEIEEIILPFPQELINYIKFPY